MPDIVSLRYFPTDVPFRDPHDPGLAAPPEGRPYERVALHADGSATHKLVYPDLRRAAHDPDAAAVAQSFAEAREALYCRQARAWFVWDGALWREDRGGTVGVAVAALARDAIAEATRGVAPPAPLASPNQPRFWRVKSSRRARGTRTRCCSGRRAARSIWRPARCGPPRPATASSARRWLRRRTRRRARAGKPFSTRRWAATRR